MRTQKERGAGIFWRGGIALRRTQKERQAPARCPPPAGCGEDRSSAHSAHRNGHFPSPWKMSETPRAVRRDRAQYVGTRHERSERSGAREGISVWRGGGALLSVAARCDPDTLSWRPKCSSQAHYAAAAPRPARISSGGMPGKTGRPRPWRGCCPVPAGPAAGGRPPCARPPPPPQHLVVLSHWNKNLSKNDKKHL